MCENCRANREMALEEIRRLLDGEGELYESFRNLVDSDDETPTEALEEMYEAARAKAIAVFAATAAAFCTADVTVEGHLPVSMILGLWAGDQMRQEEIEEEISRMRNRLGMGEN